MKFKFFKFDCLCSLQLNDNDDVNDSDDCDEDDSGDSDDSGGDDDSAGVGASHGASARSHTVKVPNIIFLLSVLYNCVILLKR